MWETRRRDLGVRHPLTLETQRHLATALVRGSQFEKAIAPYRDLYSYYRDQYGTKDQWTDEAKEQLEMTLQWFKNHE